MTRKKATTPPAAASKVGRAVAPAAPNAEEYVAVPKALMEELMKYLLTRPAGEVEHMTVPIRFGGAARAVSFATKTPADEPPPPPKE